MSIEATRVVQVVNISVTRNGDTTQLQPILIKNIGDSGGIQSIQGGNNINVDNTDPLNPVVNVEGLGSAAFTESSDYATSAQGEKADTALQQSKRETKTLSSQETLDWDSEFNVKDYDLNTITQLIDSNLPIGVISKSIKILSKGGFLELPDYWKALNDSENYIGSHDNLINVECINGNSGSEKIYYSNKTVKPIYNYYVDASNGDDSNDGLTESTAWATLSMLNKDLVVKGETINVLVKSDTYNTTDDYLLFNTFNDDVLGAVFNIEFESNSIMDGVNMVGSEDGVEQSGNIAWTLNIIGNGLIIQNYADAGSTSPNGISNRGATTVNAYDVNIINCDDGFSSHGNAFMNIYNCSASDCDKSPFIHVENATVNAYNSVFVERLTGGSFGVAVTDSLSNVDIYCKNCVFIPNSSTISRFSGVFDNCHIGGFNNAVTLTSGNSVLPQINNSFINIYVDGRNYLSLNKCYGKFSTRIRTGGSLSVLNCSISSPATGQTNVFFSNFNSGGSQYLEVHNNIFEMTSGFMSVDSNNATHIVNANAEFFNNCLYGVTYDTDLIAADSGGTVIVDTLTSDPLIGDADSLLMTDYAYNDSSPCIGAGVGGENIGFSQEEVVITGNK